MISFLVPLLLFSPKVCSCPVFSVYVSLSLPTLSGMSGTGASFLKMPRGVSRTAHLPSPAAPTSRCAGTPVSVPWATREKPAAHAVRRRSARGPGQLVGGIFLGQYLCCFFALGSWSFRSLSVIFCFSLWSSLSVCLFTGAFSARVFKVITGTFGSNSLSSCGAIYPVAFCFVVPFLPSGSVG